MTKDLNYDGLVNANVSEVSGAVFECLNVLQNKPPHIRTSASALLFLLLCERFRAEPQDVFVAAKNLLASNEAETDVRFLALKAYIAHEH